MQRSSRKGSSRKDYPAQISFTASQKAQRTNLARYIAKEYLAIE
jgi:hypothetical protein